MGEGKGKRTFISVSSSSSSEEEEEEEEVEDDSGDEEYDDEDEMINLPSSDDGSEWSDEEKVDPECIDDHHVDDESICNRVINLLQGGNDLQPLKLDECKSYLRKHGLRLTGTKAVCIQRIQEHWRIKDGQAEKLYPRSSFFINCTGDVCNGDVVLFTQRVYEKFDKMKRSGNVLGKRTIAGRVVKESYGAAKQQHTFTVEILWSMGFKRLPPLFPLLVKGRNLYKLKTFRQHWDNEAERSQVLAEKHKRGTEARLVRAMKRSGAANRGAKRQRPSHHTRPSSQTSCRNKKPTHATQPEKGKRINNHLKASAPVPAKMKRVTKQVPKSSLRYLEPTYPNNDRPTHQRYSLNNPHIRHHTQMQFDYRDIPHPAHAYREASPISYEVGSASNGMRMPPHIRPYTNSTMGPALHAQGIKHNSHTLNRFDPRHVNHFQHQISIDRQSHPINFGTQRYGQRSGYLHCSTPGCHNIGSESCVVSSCRNCCRMRGNRCLHHELHHPF